MNGFWRVVGWLLMLIGFAAIGVIAYLIGTGRVPGNFLTGLLVATPALVVVFIGSAIARAAKRRSTTVFNEPDPEWTRRRLRER